jgi:hypothetical protein
VQLQKIARIGMSNDIRDEEVASSINSAMNNTLCRLSADTPAGDCQMTANIGQEQQLHNQVLDFLLIRCFGHITTK